MADDRVPQSDPELKARLDEALEDAASGQLVSHEAVWETIERRRTALHPLEEQMKKIGVIASWSSSHYPTEISESYLAGLRVRIDSRQSRTGALLSVRHASAAL